VSSPRRNVLSCVSAIVVIDDNGSIIYQRRYEDEEAFSFNDYFSGIIKAFDSFASNAACDSARSIDLKDVSIQIKQCFHEKKNYYFLLIHSNRQEDFKLNSFIYMRLKLIINIFERSSFIPDEAYLDEIVYSPDKVIENLFQKNELVEKNETNHSRQRISGRKKQYETDSINAFFIITPGGLCLFQHVLDESFAVNKMLLSGFLSTLQSLIKQLSNEEMHLLTLKKRTFIFRLLKLKKTYFCYSS